MTTTSKIVTPTPGQSFRVGTTIPFSYQLSYNEALFFPPTVDILLQKEGEDFAVEIANGLTADASDSDEETITHAINLANFANANLSAGEYKLMTIEHNMQRMAFRAGHLMTRRVTGDQSLRLLPQLGPGPVKLQPAADSSGN